MFYNPFDAIAQSLSDLKKDIFDDSYMMRPGNIICKNCKTSMAEFLETGFVGCANCYEAFKSQAKEWALEIHGRGYHIGKMPKKASSIAMKRRELERLRQEEQVAVREKDYLRADELYNKIKALEEELK